MFLSSVLLLPVSFCTPTMNECDLNIEGEEGANVVVCYNFCDRDCSSILGCKISRKWQITFYAPLPLYFHLLYLSHPRPITPGYRTHTPNFKLIPVYCHDLNKHHHHYCDHHPWHNHHLLNAECLSEMPPIILAMLCPSRLMCHVRGLARRGSVVAISGLPFPSYLCLR